MQKLKKTLKDLWLDESGQGATEYILILVVVATIVFVFKKEIVGIIQGKTQEAGNKLSNTMGKLSQ